MSDKKIIIFLNRETIWQSFCRDGIMCGYILGSVWFNQNYIGGSYFVNFMILLLGIIWLIGVWQKYSENSNQFRSEEAAIKYLNNRIQAEEGGER